MYAFGSILVYRADKVLINILCHERDHGSRCLCDRYKCGIKCHIRRSLVITFACYPEAFTRTADIPVGKLVNEIGKISCCFGYTVVCKVIIKLSDHRIKTGKDEFIHYRKIKLLYVILCRIKVVDIRIKRPERVCVPECTHELTLSLYNCSFAEA